MMEIAKVNKDSIYYDEISKDELDALGFEFLSSESYITYSLVDGGVLSAISYSITFEDADILYIYTKECEKKKGYAYKLIMESFDRLKEKGVKNVFLEVRESNYKAIGLYEKCGFVKFGIRKNYYKNGENAILMKASL